MLSLNDLSFFEVDSKVRVKLYRAFYVDIDPILIEEVIGSFEIVDSKLKCRLNFERLEKKFMRFFGGFKRDLTYVLNGNRAIFVDADLGLPLVGTNFLGIQDKGSEILEIKPITNCNADCSFCSVNEGPSSNKEVDFVVDVDYLIDETAAVLEFKGANDMSLWLNPHGEPTLYSKLVEYCSAMLENTHVKDIHIITNGMLLTKPLVDSLRSLVDATGKKIHLSVSMSGLGSTPQEKSKINKKGLSSSKLTMGEVYNLNLVLHNVKYAAPLLSVTITPVYVKGMNDIEMKNLIDFSKEISSNIAIQKFCINKRGRNPVKEQSWDSFRSELKELEKETGVTLLQPLGKLQTTKELPIDVNKDDVINVRVICSGRYVKEKLGVYEFSNGARAVTLIDCRASKGVVKAKVLQCKYNNILAKC